MTVTRERKRIILITILAMLTLFTMYGSIRVYILSKDYVAVRTEREQAEEEYTRLHNELKEIKALEEASNELKSQKVDIQNGLIKINALSNDLQEEILQVVEMNEGYLKESKLILSRIDRLNSVVKDLNIPIE